MLGDLSELKSDFVARFWARVDRRENNQCWAWLGEDDGCGRGRVNIRRLSKNKRIYKYAYRVAWELTKGPISDGLFLLHNCPGGDNPNCVNPDHLFLGTQRDNVLDMHRKGRADSFGYKKEKALGVHPNRRLGETIRAA